MAKTRYSGIRRSLHLAARSIFQRRLRAALSVLGVVCGVTAVFAMICISEGAKRKAVRQVEALGARNVIIATKKVSDKRSASASESVSPGLTLDDASFITRSIGAVEATASVKDLTAAVLEAGLDFTPNVSAVSSSYFDVMELTISSGRRLSILDEKDRSQVCVVGADIAERLSGGAFPGGLVRIDNADFTVVGTIGRRGVSSDKSAPVAMRDFNRAALIPIGSEGAVNPRTDAMAAQADSAGEVAQIIVRMRSADLVEASVEVIKRILSLTHNGIDDYAVIVPREILMKARETQRVFNLVMGSIAGISMLVGGIGIMNIMLAVIAERKREIGIRRAVGASQRRIMTQFLSESGILTTVGGITGIVTGIAFTLVAAAYSGWEVVISPWAAALSLGMSTVAGIFFGLYPAYLAAKTDPIEALRGE